MKILMLSLSKHAVVLEHRIVVRNRKGDSQRAANHDSPCSEVDHGQTVLPGFARADYRIC